MWDVLVIGIYFGLIAWIGLAVGQREQTAEEFAVGGRRIPWPLVLSSIIATEISAVTFLGVTGTGFGSDLTYLQFGIGSIAARFVVAHLFLTAFYRFGVVTVYEYLEHRFGKPPRLLAVGCFLVGRLLGSSVRLCLAAIGFQVLLGWDFSLTLLTFVALSIVYTYWGGIRAVIWTDLVQALVFIGGGLAVAVWLLISVGPVTIWEVGAAAGRFQIFQFSALDGPWWNQPNLFYLAVLNGFLLTVAALGTDQDLTQRMLTCSNVGDARRSVILSGLIGVPVAGLFLLIGVGIYAYSQVNPDFLPPVNAEGGVDSGKVFAHFIRHELPAGMRGFLFAGVFAAAMSSVDSAMSALSSSASWDLYRGAVSHRPSDREMVRVSRWLVVVFGIILFTMAWMFQGTENFLYLALRLASLTGGVLLGVFLLGLLTTRGSAHAAVIGMVLGLATSTVCLWMIETNRLDLAWTWVVIIGASVTFLGGWRSGRK